MIKDMSRVTQKNRYGVVLVPVLILLVLLFVYIMNGTQGSYLHFVYFPIILSAYYWGSIKASIIAAMAGVLLGLIPLDVAEGISQNTMNWVYRTIILVIVGYVTGVLFEKTHKLNIHLENKELTSDLTGLYNIKKMFYDLGFLLEHNEPFTIISIKLSSIDGIGKYVNYDLVDKLVGGFIEEIELMFEGISMYSSSYDELIMILPKNYDYSKRLNLLMDKYSKAVKVDGFQVRLPLKAGVYSNMGINETPIAIYNKARIASEQNEENESGIYHYDVKIDTARKEIYEIAGSLQNAIANKEFYLVYQPKINIINNIISGVEVLIRWDRGERKPVGPNVFIEIAEKTGLINEISRYVIENTIKQISIWEKENIEINCAINITSQELIDQGLTEWTTSIMENNKFDRSKLELEITERVISQDGEKIIRRLEYLRQIGYRIAIDDFGTGYNSLMMTGTIPYDILKIDKYFIDKLDNIESREIIRNMINYSHALGKKVVAEGVETAEQLSYLKEYGCDEVQGYYYSKPLLPDDFVKFYREFYGKSTDKMKTNSQECC